MRLDLYAVFTSRGVAARSPVRGEQAPDDDGLVTMQRIVRTIAPSDGIRALARKGAAALRVGRPRDYGLALIAVAGAVACSALLERTLPVSAANFSLIFLSAVLLVATRTALAPALLTAVGGFLAYNYFFTAPRYTFEVTQPDELVSVVLFLVVGLLGGNLANRMRRQVAVLRATNEQSRRLLELNRRLGRSVGPDEIQATAARTLAEFAEVGVCVLGDDGAGELRALACAPEHTAVDREALATASEAATQGRPRGHGVEPGGGGSWYCLPLPLEGRRVVIAVCLGSRPAPPAPEELQLLEAYAAQVAQALTRSRLTANLEAAQVAEETERLRAALLSSVSHDLRTPLASMIGAASSLRELDAGLSASDRDELLDALLTEGQRLDRYIENLLDMTRLGHGSFTLARDWVAPADLVGAAIRRTRPLHPELAIERDVPADLPLLYVHAALIEQALFNVLENAARFSPPDEPVRITVSATRQRLRISICDRGPGIPASQRARVFDMFFTGVEAEGREHGRGLGLAICKGMVAAHGGQVHASAGADGVGTCMSIELPVAAAPPAEAEP